MGFAIDEILLKLIRSGIRRAMSGEHWGWFLVAGAAYVLHRSRRREGRPIRIQVHKGEHYVVEAHSRDTPSLSASH